MTEVMQANEVNKMLVIPGIIISTSRARSKATSICIRCKNCANTKNIPVGVAFGGAQLPRVCDSPRGENDENCPLDPYIIIPDKSEYVDQQTLKMQECPGPGFQ
jgi:DNA replication licensing factor MCM5